MSSRMLRRTSLAKQCAALLCLAALAGTLAGCRSEELPQGVPKGAALLAEAVGPLGERDVEHEPPWEVETDGVLYVHDVNTGQTSRGPIRRGQTLQLYPGWVSVAEARVDRASGVARPRRFLQERILVRFEPDHRYRLYYRQGVDQELEQIIAKANAEAASRPAAPGSELLRRGSVPVEIRRDADWVRRQADDDSTAGPGQQLSPDKRPAEEPPVLVPLPR